MKSRDPLTHISAEELYSSATASRRFAATGYSTCNLSIFTHSRKLKATTQGDYVCSNFSSINASVKNSKTSNPSEFELYTLYKVAK